MENIHEETWRNVLVSLLDIPLPTSNYFVSVQTNGLFFNRALNWFDNLQKSVVGKTELPIIHCLWRRNKFVV